MPYAVRVQVVTELASKRGNYEALQTLLVVTRRRQCRTPAHQSKQVGNETLSYFVLFLATTCLDVMLLKYNNFFSEQFLPYF